jgi:hypothetical protein
MEISHSKQAHAQKMHEQTVVRQSEGVWMWYSRTKGGRRRIATLNPLPFSVITLCSIYIYLFRNAHSSHVSLITTVHCEKVNKYLVQQCCIKIDRT